MDENTSGKNNHAREFLYVFLPPYYLNFNKAYPDSNMLE